MKLYTHEQILEETLGKKGTPRRDEYEEAIDDYISEKCKINTSKKIISSQ